MTVAPCSNWFLRQTPKTCHFLRPVAQSSTAKPVGAVGLCVKVTHPFGDGTSSGAFALPAGVHHLLDPDGLSLLSVPVQGRRGPGWISGVIWKQRLPVSSDTWREGPGGSYWHITHGALQGCSLVAFLWEDCFIILIMCCLVESREQTQPWWPATEFTWRYWDSQGHAWKCGWAPQTSIVLSH